MTCDEIMFWGAPVLFICGVVLTIYQGETEMTTHTNLIARLRSGWTTDRLLAADALESLEQQVAALTKERESHFKQIAHYCEHLAAAFGVDNSNIFLICKRVTWRHI